MSAVSKILAELRAERARLDAAIRALGAVNITGRSVGRRAANAPSTRPRRRGRLSAAARKRMSEMMKKHWASGKDEGAEKVIYISRRCTRFNIGARASTVAKQNYMNATLREGHGFYE